MQTSRSAVKFNKVDLQTLIDGTKIFWLHDNIREETIDNANPTTGEPDPVTIWVCDECVLTGVYAQPYTEEYVEQHFNEIWVLADSLETPLAKRCTNLENAVNDLTQMMTMTLSE